MKKICFMMPTVFNIGGEQRVVTSLSNALIKEGYDITLLLFKTDIEEDYSLYGLDKHAKIKYVKENLPLFRKICRKIRNLNSKYGFLKHLPSLNKFLIKQSFSIKNVNKQLRLINPDILIGVAGDFNLLCCIVKKYFPNIKTIGWQHSCFDAYFNTKGRRHYHEKELFCRMVKNLDKYIVLTKNDQSKMKEELKLEVEYIYNIKSFDSNKKAELENHIFVSAGRFDKVKGFDYLIDAFNIYIKNNPNSDWKLKIIGDGAEKESLKKQVENYHLEDKVIFPGFKKNVIKEYLDSSVYIMSSRWEGFPMVLSECMEIGLPMISFNINIMEEFIEDKKTGILVEKYDVNKMASAMKKMADDINYRKNIAKNANKKVNELSEKVIIAKWNKIFKEI